MSESSHFEQLMQAVRAGDESAGRVLFETYGGHILRIIRRHLDSRLRSQFDSIDIQQAVWASFFAIPAERVTFSTPEELALYLCAMADNKVAEAYRERAGTQKRNIHREKYLEDVGVDNPAIVRRDQATPSQLAVAEEFWERLRHGSSPKIQQMLDLLKEGHTYEEVARQTGLHPKTIQRHVRQLKKGVVG